MTQRSRTSAKPAPESLGSLGPGGWAMPDYRLYYLDEAGHITHALEIQCESDQDAIALVATRGQGAPMELWERGRFIKRFDGAERDADEHSV